MKTEVVPAVLEGKGTTSPPSPVDYVPEPGVTRSPISAEMFTPRSILIFQENWKILIQMVPFNQDGIYRVKLPPRTSIGAVPSGKNEFAKDLTKKVTLKAAEILKLDIDTGIH